MASRTAELPSRASGGARSQWMSLADFCAELGVARATAYKWSAAGPQSGRFPPFRRLPNGSIRIRRDWFEKWVDGLGPVA